MPQDSAQRKAWNEAMRSAAGVTNLPKSLQSTKRRSDRRKRVSAQRRGGIAAAAAAADGNHSSSAAGIDEEEYRAAVWLDALEQVQDADLLQDIDQEEEYNELEELDGGKKNRPAKRKKKQPKAGQVPKRFKARSLASILLEETTRSDGIAQDFISAVPINPDKRLQPAARPFCPVTGLPGLYREPRLHSYYANEEALQQLQERAPPWTSLTGTAAYLDVVKTIMPVSKKDK